MKAFIFAMEKEVTPLLNIIKVTSKETVAKKTIYHAEYKNKKFIIAVSGIGKVNAALTTALLINKYKVTAVINVGLAGSCTWAETQVGDAVLVTSTMQSDVDLRAIDPVELGYMQDYNQSLFPAGTTNYFSASKDCICATSDKFVTKELLSDPDIIKTKPAVFDMEAGAINLVCYCFGVTSVIIKIVSDIIDSDSDSDYNKNLKIALPKVLDAITSALNTII